MNILISGIGGPTPLGIAQSIKESGYVKKLIGIDGSLFAPGLYNSDLFDKTYLVPHSSAPEYWNVIEKIIATEKIDHAFIVPELEVLKWSERQHREKLPCPSSIPDLEMCKSFYDKFSTYELLRDTGLVPKTSKVAATASDEMISSFGFPFWLRAGAGAGAIGAFKITSVNDFRNWTLINPLISNFIMSEFLPGRNYAVKVLFHHGKVIRAASAERIGYLLSNAAPSGISGMCSYGRLLNNHDLASRAVQAVTKIFESKKVSPDGMFTVDFKEDETGVPKITEINIRHVSFTLAYALAGANFALDTLRLFMNDPSFNRTFTEYTFDQNYYFMRGVDAPLILIPADQMQTLE